MANRYRPGKNRSPKINSWDAGAQVTACKNTGVTGNRLKSEKQEIEMEKESK